MRWMGTHYSTWVVAVGGLTLAAAMVMFAAPAVAQPEPRSCFAVYGVGELQVIKWTDEEPFLLRGDFSITIDTPENLVAYLEDDPEKLDWNPGFLWLIAMPGSDAPLPGGLGWAPCSASWRIFLPADTYKIESFCESIIAPDFDEGPDIYEILIREETAFVLYKGEDYKCGRLYTNGPWNATTHEGELEVAGKFCACP